MVFSHASSPTLIIRPATAEDAEPLAAIGLTAWRKGIKPLVPAHIAQEFEVSNPFLPFLKACHANVLVAQIGDQLAGFGAREYAANRITDLWIAPTFEGQGLATALLQALEPKSSTPTRSSPSPPKTQEPSPSTNTSATANTTAKPAMKRHSRRASRRLICGRC